MISVPRQRVLAAACALLAVAACSHPAPPPPPPVAVQTVPVERRTMASYESLDGTVDPFLAANLAPQQSGTLVAVHANEGDRVYRGEVLAQIDPSILRATLVQQEATDVQNVAKLRQSKIQLPITSVTESAGLVQAKRTFAQQQKTQIADQANVRNTRLSYEADQKLERQGYVADSVYLQARATYVLAQQTLAQDSDKLAQDRAAVSEAEQNLANTPLQQQVVAQNRGAVEQSQGLVQQYRAAVAETTITAPFDGIVTARTLDPGSYASPTQAIYSVAQIDPTYVDFNVKDTDLAYVKHGTLVTFNASSNPDRRYTGTVYDVNAVPTTGTLLYRARIIEPNPDYSLRGGLEVSVRVTKAVHRDALTVPRASVIQTGSTGMIFTADRAGDHTIAKQRTVRLGLQDDKYVEISGDGVAAGTPVLLNQTANLRDGVAIATPEPSASPSPGASP